MIIWLTGLSGAGKTTIGQILSKKINSKSPCVFLDGDAIRAIVGDPHIGHDRQSRLANAYRIAKFAQHFESQGFHVVVSTMSLFHEIHDWNRKNFKKYFEVLIESSLEHLKKNDDKGLYGLAAKGELKNVVGHDLPAEKPLNPDLVITNNHDLPPQEIADIIFQQAQVSPA